MRTATWSMKGEPPEGDGEGAHAPGVSRLGAAPRSARC